MCVCVCVCAYRFAFMSHLDTSHITRAAPGTSHFCDPCDQWVRKSDSDFMAYQTEDRLRKQRKEQLVSPVLSKTHTHTHTHTHAHILVCAVRCGLTRGMHRLVAVLVDLLPGGCGSRKRLHVSAHVCMCVCVCVCTGCRKGCSQSGSTRRGSGCARSS